MFRFSVLSLDLRGDEMWPLKLNTPLRRHTCSWMHMNFMAYFERSGISSTCSSHQASRSVSALIAGQDKYSFTSDSTLSCGDGDGFAFAALFCLALLICCNNPDRLFPFLLYCHHLAWWLLEAVLCVKGLLVQVSQLHPCMPSLCHQDSQQSFP